MSVLLQSLYQERVKWTISLVLAHGTKKTGVGRPYFLHAVLKLWGRLCLRF